MQHGKYIASIAGCPTCLTPYKAEYQNPATITLEQIQTIAHPECEEGVLEQADFIGSTSALLRHVQQSVEREFIVAAEAGIIHQMRKSCPGKTFIPAPPEKSCECNNCPYMKLNTPAKLYRCMKDRAPEIRLDDDLIARAQKPIRRMLEMS